MEAPEFRSQALCEKIVPQYTRDIAKRVIERKFEQNEERISDVSIEFPSLLYEKTWSATNGLSYDDEVQCGPALSLFYK